MKHAIIKILLLTLVLNANAQKEMKLTLQDVLYLAKVQSLQSFLNKSYYLADYWQYRSFQANYLPSVDLNSKLLSYNNSSKLRYNSANQSDEFVRTENLSSEATININQKVGLTGGNVYVSSDLGRIQSYGDKGYIQYSSKPVHIGYSQSLFGFNSLKWERMLEPVKFEKAKRDYVQSTESMNISAINYFFQLSLARLKLKSAEYNYHQTDTLLQIAKKRFTLGSVTKDELLDLRLNKNNNAIIFQEAKLSLRKANESLLTYLMLPKDVRIDLILPDEVPQIQISSDKALEIAIKNNPEILENEMSIIQAQGEVAKTKANNRFSANLGVNVGISKNDGMYNYANSIALDGEIKNVYKPKFDEYQVVNVSVNVPILDWGKGKGYYQMAKSRQQIAEIAVQQALQQFEQNTITKVLEFNLQKEKVASAALSDSLATESYNLTVIRFKKGTVDVLKLVNSQKAKDYAVISYMNSLYQYWQRFYALRELTLYDFEKDQYIDVDFKKLIQ